MAMELDWIATALGARAAHKTARIQSLWGGYGELFRIELDGGPHRTAVVKWARPPVASANDASNARKLRSFDVEAAFYRTLASRCDDACRVARLLAARGGAAEREWVLVLEDLDASGFSVRADDASEAQVEAALGWLASFHARFAGERDAQLGTYWHLDTRRDELAAIDDAELRDAAAVITRKLAGTQFTTRLHGDAKDANFCFAPDGGVAALDFQYTGRGCGIVDVAYLLYGRGDEPADGVDRARLDSYFKKLRGALHDSIDGAAIEAEWRALYPVARLDFCRFLAGWRPSLWHGDARGQQFVRTWLRRAIAS